MATVIVQSDTDPKIEIRVTEISQNEWGGKCPRCRNVVSVTMRGEFLGRDFAIDRAIRHLDANCG